MLCNIEKSKKFIISEIVILMGELNAKVGIHTTGWKTVMGDTVMAK